MLVAKAGGEIIVVGWNKKRIQTFDGDHLTVVNVVLDGRHCDV